MLYYHELPGVDGYPGAPGKHVLENKFSDHGLLIHGTRATAITTRKGRSIDT